jgi:hypothetical protein
VTCDTCGKRIKQDEAHITEHTATTSRHWHHACCPWLKETWADKERAKDKQLSK